MCGTRAINFQTLSTKLKYRIYQDTAQFRYILYKKGNDIVDYKRYIPNSAVGCWIFYKQWNRSTLNKPNSNWVKFYFEAWSML